MSTPLGGHFITCTCPLCTGQSARNIQNAQYMGSMANAQNAHIARTTPPRQKVPLLSGDAGLNEFIIGERPRVAYDIAYFDDVEALATNTGLYMPALTLIAGLTGLPAGEVLKIRGVGSARVLPDGTTYFRLYH